MSLRPAKQSIYPLTPGNRITIATEPGQLVSFAFLVPVNGPVTPVITFSDKNGNPLGPNVQVQPGTSIAGVNMDIGYIALADSGSETVYVLGTVTTYPDLPSYNSAMAQASFMITAPGLTSTQIISPITTGGKVSTARQMVTFTNGNNAPSYNGYLVAATVGTGGAPTYAKNSQGPWPLGNGTALFTGNYGEYWLHFTSGDTAITIAGCTILALWVVEGD